MISDGFGRLCDLYLLLYFELALEEYLFVGLANDVLFSPAFSIHGA